MQKLADGVALAVVQGCMTVDAADMDRNEVEVVLEVVVDHIAELEVG